MRRGAPVPTVSPPRRWPGLLCFACRQLSRLGRSRYRRRHSARTAHAAPRLAAHLKQTAAPGCRSAAGTAVTSAATTTRPRAGRTDTSRVTHRSSIPPTSMDKCKCGSATGAPTRTLGCRVRRRQTVRAEGRVGEGRARDPRPGVCEQQEDWRSHDTGMRRRKSTAPQGSPWLLS